MSGKWADSTRSARLPKDWPRRRLRILKRDRYICHVCNNPGADEVDHVVNNDDHSDANLAAIHAFPCHAHKTALEGVAARPTRQRPPEPHPGLKGGG